MKKMYIKGLFADLQWLGEPKELSEGNQKEDTEFSPEGGEMEYSLPNPTPLHVSIPVVALGLFIESTRWCKCSAGLSAP